MGVRATEGVTVENEDGAAAAAAAAALAAMILCAPSRS